MPILIKSAGGNNLKIYIIPYAINNRKFCRYYDPGGTIKIVEMTYPVNDY